MTTELNPSTHAETAAGGDRAAEIARLRRRAHRERTARLEAERIGESATRELYATVQRLRQAEAELRGEAELAECSHALSRVLRSQLDPTQLLNRAVAELGPVLALDRCLVRVADPDRLGHMVAQWTTRGVDPLPEGVDPPQSWVALLEREGDRGRSVWVTDLADEPRLDDDGAAARGLRARAVGAVPLQAGDRTAGWLVMHRTSAGATWTDRDRAVATSFGDDLVGALLQALAHQQERDTVARLLEVDSLKTQMVSTVSHELRTPLSSIRGYLELWEDGQLGAMPESMRSSIDVVRRNCVRLEGLVDNLLALSRADSGRVDPSVPVDLPELLAEVERTLAPTLTERRLRMQIGPAEPVPGLTGRPAELERVLINLLHNAVKFTPDGGHVSLTAHSVGETLELVVADDGIGIPTEEQDHLFERFFRASNALGAEIQGTGLGLALVEAVVRQHGGSVQLESAAGGGTTVTVRLPVGAHA